MKNGFIPVHFTEYAVQIMAMVGIVVIGKLWMKWKIAKAERQAEDHEPARQTDHHPASEQK